MEMGPQWTEVVRSRVFFSVAQHQSSPAGALTAAVPALQHQEQVGCLGQLHSASVVDTTQATPPPLRETGVFHHLACCRSPLGGSAARVHWFPRRMPLCVCLLFQDQRVRCDLHQIDGCSMRRRTALCAIVTVTGVAVIAAAALHGYQNAGRLVPATARVASPTKPFVIPFPSPPPGAAVNGRFHTL